MARPASMISDRITTSTSPGFRISAKDGLAPGRQAESGKELQVIDRGPGSLRDPRNRSGLGDVASAPRGIDEPSATTPPPCPPARHRQGYGVDRSSRRLWP